MNESEYDYHSETAGDYVLNILLVLYSRQPRLGLATYSLFASLVCLFVCLFVCLSFSFLVNVWRYTLHTLHASCLCTSQEAY